MSDGTSRAIEAGYRIVEEYLRQGQEVARALWPTGLSGDASASPTMALTDRLVRSASDFAGLVSELLQTVSTDRSSGPLNGQPRDTERRSPEKSSGGAFTVALVIESRGRVKAWLQLPATPLTPPVTVEPLRASPSGSALVVKVVEQATEKRIVVRVRVPDSCRPSVYAGRINCGPPGAAEGRLTVEVLPPRARS